MRISILGGGPTGAYAYRALLEMGIHNSDIKVYTRDMSFPRGSFWLRHLCSGFSKLSTIGGERIEIVHHGIREVYEEKMWRNHPNFGSMKEVINSSFGEDRTEYGYDPLIHLPLFWGPARVIRTFINYSREKEIRDNSDLVIRTLPKNFEKVDTVKSFIFHKASPSPRNMVIYDGTEAPWVRFSNLFGTLSIEFPFDFVNPQEYCETRFGSGHVFEFTDMAPGTVPIPFKDAFDGRTFLAGRYARRDRKYLAHDAYDEVKFLIKKLTM